MARLLALNALFFLVPFAVYAGWLLVTQRRWLNVTDWDNRTVIILSAIGAFLVIVGLVVLVSFSGTSTNEPYIPAEIRDGEIIPGRFGDE